MDLSCVVIVIESDGSVKLVSIADDNWNGQMHLGDLFDTAPNKFPSSAHIVIDGITLVES